MTDAWVKSNISSITIGVRTKNFDESCFLIKCRVDRDFFNRPSLNRKNINVIKNNVSNNQQMSI